MAKIVVGSSSLTQPLLLYPGLGPAMLDIRERLGVALVEEKRMQHRLRWFGRIQRRPAEAPIRNGVIRQIGNEKRGRGRPNMTWEESVKRDLKNWCIT
jgi:hypothetical protein